MTSKVACLLLLGAHARRQRQPIEDGEQASQEMLSEPARQEGIARHNLLETASEDDEAWRRKYGWRRTTTTPPPPPAPPAQPACKTKVPIPAPFPPGPAPTPPKGDGYYGVPKDGIMTYTVIGDINEIPDFQPECVSSFCDKNVGQKVPDSCCNTEMWRNSKGDLPKTFFGTGPPDIRYHPDTKEEATCYPRVAPGPFNGQAGGKNVQWIRNYLGCEDGKLFAHENCVPGGTQYITPEQYQAGKDTTDCDSGDCAWSYPMSREEGIQHFENGTGESCYCSTQSYLKEGPGCYIAFATLAQYAGMYPGVFVRIGGTCDGPEAPAPAPVSENSAPADAAIQYFRFKDHANLPAECALYEKEDVGKKVPDSCCSEDNSAADGWSFTPADTRVSPWEKSSSTYSCYVRERAPPNNGTFIRNFFGCNDGVLTGAEGCVPAGLGMGKGYPMNMETAQKHATENGDVDSCNCEDTYVGNGCFVAATGYSKGLPGAGPEANFLKISGSACT